MDERPSDAFAAIYICGVYKRGYPSTNYPHNLRAAVLPRVEAVKKWDWLRAETAKTLENQRARRCLSQFFHSLGEATKMLDRNIDDKKIPPRDPSSCQLSADSPAPGGHSAERILVAAEMHPAREGEYGNGVVARLP